jgi:hypothetical protein
MGDSFDTAARPFPIENSSVHHFWIMEKVEIDRLKWLESEKAGRDIGADRAHFIWCFHGHRAKWLCEMRAATGLGPHYS